MTNITLAKLATSITRSGSKQTYYTTRLLVDKDLINACYLAYAYFRWVDDVVDGDTPHAVSSRALNERPAFVKQQRALIDYLYQNERPNDLTLEEEMVADLIAEDKGKSDLLRSYIQNFLDILEFDAKRRGHFICQQELTWYSDSLAKAVTDGIQHFIGHDYVYPTSENQYLAVTAAHITHMLRDMVADIQNGYINIPIEYLNTHNIRPGDIKSPAFRAWVQSRVELARSYLGEGKRYLDTLDLLRGKIAGYWYCARYEVVLDAIERDGYILRAAYRRGALDWLKIIGLGVLVSIRHFLGWRKFIHQVLLGRWNAINESRSKVVHSEKQKIT